MKNEGVEGEEEEVISVSGLMHYYYYSGYAYIFITYY